jgi:hypothetical protein
MKIKREVLLKALEAVKPGLANKEFIEQATAFAFIKGSVVTYNDEISVSYPIEGLDIEGAIKADELYALLTKIKARTKDDPDEVELTVNENEVLLTSGTRLKAGFTLQSEVKLPLKEELAKKSKWVNLPEDFIAGLEFVKPSVARQVFNQPVLTCVHVHKDGYIEASNGHRLAYFALANPMGVETFLIPLSSLPDLIRFKPNQVATGHGWMHFKSAGDAIISCRIFADPFPDTSALKNVEGKVLSIADPQLLDEAIDRASVFAQRDIESKEFIRFDISENQITVSSTLETGGRFEESVRFKYSGKPFSFTTSPSVVQGVFTKDKTVTISDNRLKWEKDNWLIVGVLKVTKE